MPDQTQTTPPESPSPSSPLAVPELATMRREIDRIDDALHDLLMQRAGLSAHMATSRVKGSAPSFRPGREALILRRILGRHSGPLPRAVLVRLWRDIIASSLAQQGNFSMAVVQANAAALGSSSPEGVSARLARGQFGLLTPMKVHPTTSRVLSAVAAGEASVAVLPAPEDGEPPEAAWWVQMEAPRLQVVAGLPFLAPREQGSPLAYAIAAIAPEPTGRDRTLLRLEPEAEHTRPRITAAFAAIGLTPRWLLRRELPNPMALVEVEGFLAPDDPRLAALPFARTQILGAYAEPEMEDEA